VEDIVVIGGKGTAVNVAEQIDDAYRNFGAPQRFRGFAIDDPALGSYIAGFPVVCGTRDVARWVRAEGAKTIFALYRPDVMRERVALLASFDLTPELLATFVHPCAYVSRSATIGRGSVVLAHASLMKDVVIGDCCVLNAQVIVEHDSRIDDSCFLAAGACLGARVSVGRGAFIGMQAVLREGTSVGEFGFVGMGSVVTCDVEQGTRVYGNPARKQA
jgi:sugar O-acyltransferase (sialic acid O-acetyltransferase NeuD family)